MSFKSIGRRTGVFFLARIGMSKERITADLDGVKDRMSALSVGLRDKLSRRDQVESIEFDDAKQRAMERQQWTDEEFEANARQLSTLYGKRFRGFMCVALISMLYGFIVLFQTERLMSFAAICTWAAFLLLLAMQAAFLRWQIQTRTLGSLRDWLLGS